MDTRVKQFVERKTLRGFAALARDWSIIIATIALSLRVDHWLFYLVAVWVIGACQYAIGEVLLHEASHYNLFRSRRLNDLMEPFYALPFFQTLKEYRRQHGLHHSRLGHRYDDHVVDDFHMFGLLDRRTSMFVAWFIKPLLGYPGFLYSKSLLLPDKASEGSADFKDVRLLAFWVVAAATFYAFGALDVLLFYWIVPLYWAFCSLLFWQEVREHFSTKTRTRSNLGVLYNHVFHNQGYHALHHRYPTIPWYRLPAAFQALQDDTTRDIVGDLTTGFFDVYRRIRQSARA